MSSRPDPDAPRGYEERDASWRGLALAGLGLIVLIAISFVLMGGLETGLERADARRAEPVHPMAAFRRPPTTAPLQASPSSGLETFLLRQEELTSTYGWLDPTQGLVRLPIERALELTLERGLPARAPAPEADR